MIIKVLGFLLHLRVWMSFKRHGSSLRWRDIDISWIPEGEISDE